MALTRLRWIPSIAMIAVGGVLMLVSLATQISGYAAAIDLLFAFGLMCVGICALFVTAIVTANAERRARIAAFERAHGLEPVPDPRDLPRARVVR